MIHENSTMEKIALELQKEIQSRQFVFKIICEDRICSHVTIMGTFEPNESFEKGILLTENHFTIFVWPFPRGGIYTGGNVTVELNKGFGFRPCFDHLDIKPKEAVERIIVWLENKREIVRQNKLGK